MKVFWLFMILSFATGAAAQLRRCRNPSCNEAISIVRAYRDFVSPDQTFQFKALSTFAILSKQGGTWEADVRRARACLIGKVNGKRGFFPSELVEEISVFERDPRFVVPLQVG
jgi:hypothetical protein